MPLFTGANIDPASIGSTKIKNEAAQFLQQLAGSLEDDICTALLDGNVAMAERLVLWQTQAKKFARLLKNTGGAGATN